MIYVNPASNTWQTMTVPAATDNQVSEGEDWKHGELVTAEIMQPILVEEKKFNAPNFASNYVYDDLKIIAKDLFFKFNIQNVHK